jgi:hypothetical protein
MDWSWTIQESGRGQGCSHSFHWNNFVSEDGGQTWRMQEELEDGDENGLAHYKHDACKSHTQLWPEQNGD